VTIGNSSFFSAHEARIRRKRVIWRMWFVFMNLMIRNVIEMKA
jgi:hypothetical protein